MLKTKCLEFLHQQLNDNKISQIKKGMLEDLEHFVQSVLANNQTTKIVTKMTSSPEKDKEKVEHAQKNS